MGEQKSHDSTSHDIITPGEKRFIWAPDINTMLNVNFYNLNAKNAKC